METISNEFSGRIKVTKLHWLTLLADNDTKQINRRPTGERKFKIRLTPIRRPPPGSIAFELCGGGRFKFEGDPNNDHDNVSEIH